MKKNKKLFKKVLTYTYVYNIIILTKLRKEMIKMKELIKDNLKVVEIKKGHTYEGKKLTKNGVWRKFTRFNDVSLESAMKYVESKMC